MELNTTWFLLIGVLLTGYAILDGFDLGVGILHLFLKKDEERRGAMQAIGPVWDGNEVWLVTGGGALFAAFPEVYATVFSGFYVALMLVLVGLIFRAMSLEFRSKVDHPGWRGFWDIAFSVSSLLCALLFGVALGNVVRGIPLDARHVFAGNFLGLLNPYALILGIVTVALFALHGGLYMTLKTDGQWRDRYATWARKIFRVFAAAWLALAVAHFVLTPDPTAVFQARPWALAIPIVALLAAVGIPLNLKKERFRAAFASSCVLIASLMGLAGQSMYPNLVPSNPSPEFSLNIQNAASSDGTLRIMLIIALIGMPLVVGYTIVVYRIFKGKVTPGAGPY